MKKLIVQFTFIVLAISMVFISSVSAATINATDCTEAAINTAISAASTGDTITVKGGAACTATWSGEIDISTKQLKLIGGGKTVTLITNGGVIFGTNSRLTGFGFTGTTARGGNGDGWRIDHNNFTYADTGTFNIVIRGERPTAHPTGLIDNNTFTRGRISVFGYPDENAGNASSLWSWGQPTGLGTGTNVVYIEDNTFTSGASDVFYIDCMDANYGARFVFRYNTLYNTSTQLHGIQGVTNRGNPRWEMYNNSYTVTVANYAALWARGGTGVMYGNTISGPYTLNINIDNQSSTRFGDYAEVGCPYIGTGCDGTNPRDGNRTGMEGYPCRDQIGRGQDVPQWAVGQPYAQALAPLYSWNNTKSGADVSAPTITKEAPLSGCTPSNVNRNLVHLKANRDFYYSTAIQTSKGNPFNGTSGVGYGLLAYRPDTCDPLPVATGAPNEPGGGVAYWATDTNTLYRCSARDTWTVHYKPYTYPHPLSRPEPPKNLRIGQ